MNHQDINIQTRNEIRWHCFGKNDGTDDTVRAYFYTEPLTIDEKVRSMSVHFKPVEDNWCGLTETGKGIVNELLSLPGVLAVFAGAFEMHLSRKDDALWELIHDDVLAVINRRLFYGAAVISELPYHRRNQPTIRWCDDAFQDHVRSYHLSTSLKLDKNDNYQESITRPADHQSHPTLTAACLHLVNTIQAWRGVVWIWVSQSVLKVQLAPVFNWDDYHPAILELLNETLCDGQAWIETGTLISREI